jgi:NlpC/P60 family putative phage cell wall peptidase
VSSPPLAEPLGVDPRRQAIIAEARTWLGTRFHHYAWLKGAGCDCLGLIYGVYRACGLVGEIDIPYYRPDFMQHRDDERYLEGLLKYGHRVEQPATGDVALFKYGRVFGHAAIVIAWPRLIHAFAERGEVCLGVADQGRLRGRRLVFLSVF